MTAYVALGRYDDFESAAGCMVEVEDRICPDLSAVQVYGRLAEVFREAYRQVSPIHEMLRPVES